MKVLVACEESQVVCKAFRERGHEAYSCDVIECSGGHPEWHIQADVIPLLNGNCSFKTCDGVEHNVDGKWDMIIAHPPCQKLSNATGVNLGRKDCVCKTPEWRERFFNDRTEAVIFFLRFLCCECDKVCVENPVGYMNTHFAKPSQYIDPFQFGDPWKKKTCLWLKGLPLLVPTNEVEPLGKWVRHHLKGKDDLKGYKNKGVYSARERSKTFLGISKAMSEQWG